MYKAFATDYLRGQLGHDPKAKAWLDKVEGKFGPVVKLDARSTLLSPPLSEAPGWVVYAMGEELRAKYDEAILPLFKVQDEAFSKIQDEARAGRMSEGEAGAAIKRLFDGFTRSCSMFLATVLGLPDGDDQPHGCRHEYVNVGFTSVTMACRHCGKGA